MADLSVIVRRILRHRIKSGEGVEKVISELLGNNWQSMLSGSRSGREGVVQNLVEQIQAMLRNTSFVETGRLPADTRLELDESTLIA